MNLKFNIKDMLVIAIAMIMSFTVTAQDDKSKRPSPPAEVSETVDGVKITINYSQPAVKGRKIFGGLEPYGKVWRAGANEATWIEFSDDVTINGKDLKAGKYAFFITPRENKDWTLIFNSEWEQWGAYELDASKNALTVDVTPEDNENTERLTYDISEDGTVTMKWADKSVPFAVSAK